MPDGSFWVTRQLGNCTDARLKIPLQLRGTKGETDLLAFCKTGSPRITFRCGACHDCMYRHVDEASGAFLEKVRPAHSQAPRRHGSPSFASSACQLTLESLQGRVGSGGFCEGYTFVSTAALSTGASEHWHQHCCIGNMTARRGDLMTAAADGGAGSAGGTGQEAGCSGGGGVAAVPHLAVAGSLRHARRAAKTSWALTTVQAQAQASRAARSAATML